jgi:ABC-type branched-subunit amino acid transport system substrate-binding protein
MLGEIPPPQQKPSYLPIVQSPTNDAMDESRQRFADHRLEDIVRGKIAREHNKVGVGPRQVKGGIKMSITRRQALGSAGAAIAASSLAKPAIAVNEPIRVGYLPALTGPSSSTGIGINRGIQLAVQEINAAGGVNGRQIELITRDTQSDPTKAVNGAAELSHGQNVSVVFGPVNSGESLAVVPLLARTSTPQVHPCWVDTLTDPQKYPMCFRNAPTNQQIGAAANRYVVDVLKRNKVAVISDTTGYGTASVNAYVPMLQARGAEVVYRGNVDAANPDLKPELLRMQSAGAEAVMPWSVNAGFHASSTRAATWLGTCRSSARPRLVRGRQRRCWRSLNTGQRFIQTISAMYVMALAASFRSAPPPLWTV